jgi:predicted nucleic acid-binding protein
VIVLDASAVVELLLGTPLGRAIASRIADPVMPLHIPHLTDVEVDQALRRYARKGEIGEADGEQAIVDLRELDLERHPHEPLMERVWELRDNLTAYDAVYLALAEALEATLVTCDAALAQVPGVRARVEVVSKSG